MTEAIVRAESAVDYGVIERVLAVGDLAKLTPDERARLYFETCRSLGLNPLTNPFGYIHLNNQLRLYALKAATDQLRQIHGISISKIERAIVGGSAIATAYAHSADGREDSDVGIVCVDGLRGDALANALMKSVTKAKRRVTLSICGLGMLDESEISGVDGAAVVRVDAGGRVVPAAAP
jgi:hypothetical protein